MTSQLHLSFMSIFDVQSVLMYVCVCGPPGNILLMKKVPPPPHGSVSTSQQTVAATGWCNSNLILLISPAVTSSDLTGSCHTAPDDVIILEHH